MKRSLYLIVIIAILLFSLTGCLGTKDIIEDVRLDETKIESGTSKGILYKVEGGNSSMYLFGTIHVGEEDMYPLSLEVERAIRESDVLALEIDLSSISEVETLRVVSKYGMYDDGRKLRDTIPRDLFMASLHRLEPLGLNAMTLDMFKPWYVAILLTQSVFMEMGLDTELGVETYLINKFEGKEIISLETIEDQISLFAMIDDRSQVIFLREALESIDAELDEMSQMLEMWKNGDIEGFSELRSHTLKEGSTPSLREYSYALTKGRDIKMADKLDQILKSSDQRTHFVAVGTLHIVGEGSIVELLQNKGYNVTLITNSN